ncbi:hypothetical protein ACN2CC_17925 [Mesorhizobium muleiense]|uniref:hypothetical protein n=1 Tax=Mesorhizobium muleiense TaxID=1004279 RepID=UPI003AFA6AE4
MTRPGHQTVVRRRACTMIQQAFPANGINFAQPTVQVGNDEKQAAAAAADVISLAQQKAAQTAQGGEQEAAIIRQRLIFWSDGNVRSDASLAPHHLPGFIVAPGETDVLFTGSVIFIIALLMMLGSLYFWLHSLPERIAHGASQVQFQLVAVLALLALCVLGCGIASCDRSHSRLLDAVVHHG